MVTHVDDVAKEEFNRAVEEAEAYGEPDPAPDEVFRSLCRRMSQEIKRQVRTGLSNSDAFEDLPDSHHSERERIVDVLCSSLQVHCISALEYRAITKGRNSFLSNKEVTGIPDLKQALEAVAVSHRRLRREYIRRATGQFREEMVQYMEHVVRRREAAEGSPHAKTVRFRQAIEKVAGDLEQHLKVYQGEALAELQSTLPERIRVLARDARHNALKKLRLLTRHEQASTPYQSLNAALRRGAVWTRKGIDYPDSLTRWVVDSVATDWGPCIIGAARNVVARLGRRSSCLIDRLLSEATNNADGSLLIEEIEALKAAHERAARTCLMWTDDRLEALRKSVYVELENIVRKPIDDRCEQAQRDGENQGVGAKRRIIEVFCQAGEAALEQIGGQLETFLETQYRGLLSEIEARYLHPNATPLAAVLKTLLGTSTGEAGAWHERELRSAAEFVTTTRERLERIATDETVLQEALL